MPLPLPNEIPKKGETPVGRPSPEPVQNEAEEAIRLCSFVRDIGHRPNIFVLLSASNCPPCATLKEVVREARRQDFGFPPLFLLTLGDAELLDDRLTSITGRSIRILPSIFYRDPHGVLHWLEGAGDKAGPYHAGRILEWLRRKGHMTG
jgi:hypothetical protein